MGLVKTEQHPDIGQYLGVKGPITVLGILIHIWQNLAEDKECKNNISLGNLIKIRQDSSTSTNELGFRKGLNRGEESEEDCGITVSIKGSEAGSETQF